LLGISRRRVIRIKNRARRVDLKGIIYGNRGRSKEAYRRGRKETRNTLKLIFAKNHSLKFYN